MEDPRGAGLRGKRQADHCGTDESRPHGAVPFFTSRSPPLTSETSCHQARSANGSRAAVAAAGAAGVSSAAQAQNRYSPR
jgi:hypothetical protein